MLQVKYVIAALLGKLGKYAVLKIVVSIALLGGVGFATIYHFSKQPTTLPEQPTKPNHQLMTPDSHLDQGSQSRNGQSSSGSGSSQATGSTNETSTGSSGKTNKSGSTGSGSSRTLTSLVGPATPNVFHINGTSIVDPFGHNFIPVGANVDGPQFVWPGPTIGRSNVAKDYWHWNTIRLTLCWSTSDNYPNWNVVWPGHPSVPGYDGCDNGGGYHYPDNDDLDGIISEYTSRGIVVMIDLQHFNPGAALSATDRSFVEHWWQYIANRYKGNSYVWYNLLNEPVGEPGDLGPWYDITNNLAGQVRSTGAQNIMVADGSCTGQEACDWTCNMFPMSNSAIYTYGNQLQQTYGNMLFSLHAYNVWGSNKDQYSDCSSDQATLYAQLDYRMNSYIDAIHGKGLPLVIGETGAFTDPAQEDWWQNGSFDGVKTVYRTAPSKGVGIIAWHGSGGDYNLGNCDWSYALDPPNWCGSWTPNIWGQLLYNYGRQINP